MMKKYTEAIDMIAYYQENFRHPKMEQFCISGLYDLFPERGDTEFQIKHKWPECWPNVEKGGVYMFIDVTGNVLYIGKTNKFGRRLGNYCMYNETKGCKLKQDTWKGQPRFVITVAVPDSTWFEAYSLEAYLIDNIPTSDNVMGNKAYGTLQG